MAANGSPEVKLTNIPAKLKSADITRFAQRATQLKTVKPAVAYWCIYWMVSQVLSKGLHNQNDSCRLYTTQLMDKLEMMKVDHPNDAAIADDMAGRSCVEQFGLETFQRAENAMSANKASGQTADAFQAAATFLDLMQIWPSPAPGPEIAAKSKFAKFHALRIAKAIKAGEDPNLSNPPPPPTAADEEAMVLDPRDPEVRQILEGAPQPDTAASKNLQPTVEDVPDDQAAIKTTTSPPVIDQPQVEPEVASAPTVDDVRKSEFQTVSRSPIPEPIDGEDFSELQLPGVPKDVKNMAPIPSTTHESFYTQPPPVKGQVSPPATVIPQSTASVPPPLPQQPTSTTRSQDIVPPVLSSPAFREELSDDEKKKIYTDVQKLARHIISALDYGDAPFAIKAMRKGLQDLERI